MPVRSLYLIGAAAGVWLVTISLFHNLQAALIAVRVVVPNSEYINPSRHLLQQGPGIVSFGHEDEEEQQQQNEQRKDEDELQEELQKFFNVSSVSSSVLTCLRSEPHWECRAALQRYMRPSIQKCLHANVPILQDVITVRGRHIVLLTLIDQIHVDVHKWTAPGAQWTCNYGRANERAGILLAQAQPPKYGGAKTSSSSSSRQSKKNVVIVDCGTEPVHSLYVKTSRPIVRTRTGGRRNLRRHRQRRPRRRAVKYDTRAWQACENLKHSILQRETPPNELNDDDNDIDDDDVGDVNDSSSTAATTDHDDTKKKNNITIVACTMIHGHHEQLLQWVEYHRLIGIQHFWVYLNEAWPSSAVSLSSMDDLPRRDYITYIPWDYSLRYARDANQQPYSPWLQDFGFQVAQVNNCLYHAKAYQQPQQEGGLAWLALFDVDEYIHVTEKAATDNYNNQGTTKATGGSVLLKLLESTQEDAVSFNSIPYGTNVNTQRELHESTRERLSKNVDPPPIVVDEQIHLTMDAVWRQDCNFSDVQQGRYKLIVRPEKVVSAGVHRVFKGARPLLLDEETQGYLHHYKRPEQGVFAGDATGFLTNPAEIVLDTSFRDQYRDKMLRILDKAKQIQGNSD